MIPLIWDLHFPHTGLVRLSEPLTYNRHVQPVCIPKINFPPGRLCTGVGWGTTLGTGNRSVLNQARLPILIQSTCRYWHRETNEVYPSMVCAGYEDGRRGDCHGDSGGPLLCFRAGRFWIQGVTSWGRPECKADEAPTVFTRVPSYYDWITEHISLN
ncbi:hypothetical protein LSH36_258g04037 [Paralvinella palmiformis]|uniref:Peptidase S1 domain-containing protein n=1 Tax=Paralvinella palmiformis TaxID=53620 RepID=A0AAD9N456_9ANNE|nr:hypothetical protein LSH36_258g04037 [Paralvinella palmiformis]